MPRACSGYSLGRWLYRLFLHVRAGQPDLSPIVGEDQADIHDLDDQIRQGDFSQLLDWLRKNIHQYGQKYEPQTLVEKITGSKITHEPYIRYLTKKYGEIYGL